MKPPKPIADMTPAEIKAFAQEVGAAETPKLSIPGFGKVAVTRRGEQTRRNPATGQASRSSSKRQKTPKFSSGATLRQTVSGKKRWASLCAALPYSQAMPSHTCTPSG